MQRREALPDLTNSTLVDCQLAPQGRLQEGARSCWALDWSQTSYLTKLISSLAASMIEPQHAIAMVVAADAGTLASAEAVSIGLIVTELVINAVKYAFPTKRKKAVILITFRFDGSAWKLTVSDNGDGRRSAAPSASQGSRRCNRGRIDKAAQVPAPRDSHRTWSSSGGHTCHLEIPFASRRMTLQKAPRWRMTRLNQRF